MQYMVCKCFVPLTLGMSNSFGGHSGHLGIFSKNSLFSKCYFSYCCGHFPNDVGKPCGSCLQLSISFKGAADEFNTGDFNVWIYHSGDAGVIRMCGT